MQCADHCDYREQPRRRFGLLDQLQRAQVLRPPRQLPARPGLVGRGRLREPDEVGARRLDPLPVLRGEQSDALAALGLLWISDGHPRNLASRP